jgi:hypothetical protein
MALVEGGSSVKASEMNYFDGRKEQLGHTPSLIVMDTNSAFLFAAAWTLIVCTPAIAKGASQTGHLCINIMANWIGPYLG